MPKDNVTFEFDVVGLSEDNLKRCLNDPGELIFDSDFSAGYAIYCYRDIALRRNYLREFFDKQMGGIYECILSYHAQEEASETDVDIPGFYSSPDGLFPQRWTYYAHPERSRLRGFGIEWRE